MAAALYWRLTALPTPEVGPLPWLPQIPHAIQAHPAWGNYLAKRAQHVADLAGQIRDLATRADDQPVWAPPGSHPSTALIGDIAVWRAARGIDPQDPRPTGGHQLEAAADLWKQHLDRDVARDTEQHNSEAGIRQLDRSDDRPPSRTRHARNAVSTFVMPETPVRMTLRTSSSR